MSIKQVSTHIIVNDARSVKTGITNTLEGTENIRVYYPSENGVDTNAFIKQFIDQLLFREGSWHSLTYPCVPFELSKAFPIMSSFLLS